MSIEDINTVHHFAAGVYAKEMHLPAGWMAGTHLHAYDHLSILAQGHVRVTCAGVATEYTAPACVLIKKGLEHRIEASTDSVWFCIHGTDETDPAKVDAVAIVKGG